MLLLRLTPQNDRCEKLSDLGHSITSANNRVRLCDLR